MLICYFCFAIFIVLYSEAYKSNFYFCKLRVLTSKFYQALTCFALGRFLF